MAGLQFENLPAAQTDRIKNDLNAQWEIEAEALRYKPFRSQQLADAELAKLNAKYQQRELEAFTQLRQQTEEQQRVQQLIKQGTQGMSREKEAGLRMNLKPEAERLVFPSEPTMTPLSISQLRAREPGEDFTKIQASIMEFAEAAPTIPKPWTLEKNEPKTKQGLINRYVGWRRYLGYEGLKPLVQRQYDDEWDVVMMGDKRFDKWWSNKKQRKPLAEIKALRTPGKIGKIMQDRMMGAEGITPLGRSITKAKPTEVVRWEQPAEVASWLVDKFKKPEPTPSVSGQLQRPTNQAEYDRVPSGTRYMGTDGQIRTKR